MFSLLKTLLDFFCGSSQTKPSEQQAPQHQQQEQYYPQHPQQHPQQHQQQHAHKPSRPNNSVDPNQINQSNDYYIGLRARANAEGDAMAKCFEQSHQAYARRDGAEAKALSTRGREHQRKMEELHKQAADWIFIQNNKDSKPGEIDLHGLYVKEAIARTDQAIQEAKNNGHFELHIIVGRGLHSKGGTAKIKPAIEELMLKHRLHAELDPNNSGVLIVQINSGNTRGVGADEITQRLERKDGSCLIM